MRFSLAVALLLAAPAAFAQTSALGHISQRGVSVSGYAAMPQDASEFGGTLGLQAPRYDAALSFTRTTFEDSAIDASANVIGADANLFVFRAGAGMPVSAAVGVRGEYTTFESDVASGVVELTRYTISPQASVSFPLPLGPSLVLTPEGRLGYSVGKVNVETIGEAIERNFEPGLNGSVMAHVTFGGIGRVALTPGLRLAKPVNGSSDADLETVPFLRLSAMF